MTRTPKLEIVHGQGVHSAYYWHLLGGNGQIVCVSESYTTKSQAKRSAKRAKELMAIAKITEAK